MQTQTGDPPYKTLNIGLPFLIPSYVFEESQLSIQIQT